jgi:phosphoenolpyruvate carboxylase
MRLYRRDVQQDVRELGAMLGDTVAEQQSEAAFETIEDLRTTAIEDDSGDGWVELASRLESLDDARAQVIARAFTTYFELINLAEEREEWTLRLTVRHPAGMKNIG